MGLIPHKKVVWGGGNVVWVTMEGEEAEGTKLWL